MDPKKEFDGYIIITNRNTGTLFVFDKRRIKDGCGRIQIKGKCAFENYKNELVWGGAKVVTEKEIQSNTKYRSFYKEYTRKKNEMEQDDKIFEELDQR